MQSKYFVSRIIQTIITLFCVFSLMWLLFRMIPGDPTAIFVSGQLSPEDIEALRRMWGLDKPLHIQYLKYMKNVFLGDFGISFSYREPVLDVILPTIKNTMILMLPAMVMAIVVGTMAGSYLGWRKAVSYTHLTLPTTPYV